MKVELRFIDRVSYEELSWWTLDRVSQIKYPVWMLDMCDKHLSDWFWICENPNKIDINRYLEMTRDLDL